MAIFYVDGRYVEDTQATLPLTDMALLRGYAVFDFLRTYNGKPFHLDEHIIRLQNSAALLDLHCRWSVAEISDIIFELLRRNQFVETNFRFLITGGDSVDSITPSNNTRLIIMATELGEFPDEWYTQGVKIITSDVTRYIPGAKSTNYIKAIIALKRARAGGAIESIYVNENNELLEGTTSNLFVVKGKTILTPDEGLLPGITRRVVLQLVDGILPMATKKIYRHDIAQYSEAFITSSNKEVVPVTRIDDIRLGDVPGPVTQEVMKLFRGYTQSW